MRQLVRPPGRSRAWGEHDVIAYVVRPLIGFSGRSRQSIVGPCRRLSALLPGVFGYNSGGPVPKLVGVTPACPIYVRYVSPCVSL